jgi:hypothetical protein
VAGLGRGLATRPDEQRYRGIPSRCNGSSAIVRTSVTCHADNIGGGTSPVNGASKRSSRPGIARWP